MKCDACEKYILKMLSGDCTEAQKRQVMEHAGTCDSCAQKLRQYETMIAAMREPVTAEPLHALSGVIPAQQKKVSWNKWLPAAAVVACGAVVLTVMLASNPAFAPPSTEMAMQREVMAAAADAQSYAEVEALDGAEVYAGAAPEMAAAPENAAPQSAAPQSAESMPMEERVIEGATGAAAEIELTSAQALQLKAALYDAGIAFVEREGVLEITDNTGALRDIIAEYGWVVPDQGTILIRLTEGDNG